MEGRVIPSPAKVYTCSSLLSFWLFVTSHLEAHLYAPTKSDLSTGDLLQCHGIIHGGVRPLCLILDKG